MVKILNNKIMSHNIIELYIINQHYKSHRGSVDPGTPPETSKMAKLEKPAARENKEEEEEEEEEGEDEGLAQRPPERHLELISDQTRIDLDRSLDLYRRPSPSRPRG